MSREFQTISGASIALKYAGVTDAGTFQGYASTFGGGSDSHNDIVARGAFTKTLAEHRAASTMPALLWGHDPSEPIGVWTSLAEDGTGLKAAGKLTLDVQRARDAHALMKDGALGLSIGYRTRQADRQKDGTRLLKDLQLFEVSAVAMPSNSAARITAVKSFDPDTITNIRAFETFLREAGFPRAFAKSLAVSGWKAAVAHRDTESRSALAQLIVRKAAEIAQLTKGNLT